jgi:UDP-2-acetamido-3-amino-2,3-dideoxy-glucuronate N-acetyltransferase
VTRDVPAYALVRGTPARRTGWMSQTGDKLGHDLVCPRSGAKYRQIGLDQLELIAS